MNLIKKTFKLGEHTVTLETGNIARQATGAVWISIEDTTLLVTVVAEKEAKPGRDFFPLTVNYQERTYASGRIPGGFFKREGRPSENETLIARLMDRPLRPLFPDGFNNEVQIIATVLSANPEIPADIPAMIGASAALAIAGVPFNGPIGACRVGYINNQFVLNPNRSQLPESALDLVVAGTESAVLMVESEAQELSEEIMLGAVMFGHEQMQTIIQAIREFAADVGNPRWDWVAPAENEALNAKVQAALGDQLVAAYQIADKMERRDQLVAIRNTVLEQLIVPDSEESPSAEEVSEIIGKFEKNTVRSRIIQGHPRIDGRDTDMIRAIYVNTNVLPRTHGSAIFTRGETQALVVCTLGTAKDAQLIDGLHGETKDAFMLHYNFPPYSVGECGLVGSPKRREIGHGRLARRGVQAVLPKEDEFPYAIRVVSEITESNGSSSMASVCGASLALMDAGVPIKAPVAGIAMGLIKEESGYAVLSDILGDEDHLGDMDFKVAGTANGVTALQMDIKIEGITREIMDVALRQAQAGRLHILEVMNKAIDTARADVSEFAPRIISMQINPEKIRDVIGKGGATIRSITETTGTSIDITDDGVIKIAAVDMAAGELARQRIIELTSEIVDGEVYEGTVTRIMDFGAFVAIFPGKEGLVHISQLSHERVKDVNQVVSVGQKVTVKVMEIDRMGRVRLSMKALVEKPENAPADE